MKILNLTQHNATAEQIEQGVFDAPAEIHSTIKALLTFDELPSKERLSNNANALVDIAMDMGATHVMIGGAPFFMGVLENALKESGIAPLYAFSQRVSVEKANENGEVVKTNIFKHIGFVEA